MFGKSKDGSPDTDRAVTSIEPQSQRPDAVIGPGAARGDGGRYILDQRRHDDRWKNLG
jgi:hypothetical protein